MGARLERNFSTLTWSVVVLVGVLVLAIIFGLRLFPRLNGGQDLLEEARPAFTEERVAGSRAGISMVSSIVDLADPIVKRDGGAAAEVPKLIAFVSQGTGLPKAKVLATLSENFPHTTALLQAIPLEDVSRELPGLVSFLSKNLKLSPEEVQETLGRNFPRLTQSIAVLPTVTSDWNSVEGTQQLTRFDGTPARAVPAIRDYFAADVIAVLERQGGNFRRLESNPPEVGLLPPLLTAIGAVALLFGLGALLIFRAPEARGWEVPVAWSAVAVVGVLVLVLVVTAELFPRLNGGQDLLEEARPAFTEERVAGSRAGISMVSSIVDLADPIVKRDGGAAAEVPKLIAFVSQGTGLPKAKVLATLSENFPHTTALLQAIPLEDVSRELPGLVSFLSKNLKLSPEEVQETLGRNFPRLTQSIAVLPTVTSDWNSVEGTQQLTRFDGTPARAVPAIRDYFAADVIAVLERQGGNFRRLESRWPPVDWFPWILFVVGSIVVVYGLLMVEMTRPRAKRPIPSGERSRAVARG